MDHPQPRRRRCRPLLAAAALALLAACGHSAPGTSPPASSATAASPPNGTVTDRALPASVLTLPFRDQNDHAMTLGSLRGKTIVLTDFLTTCQEVCPMTSVNFRDVADATARSGLAQSVQLVEITVDPDRDHPARLAAYQKLFGTARPNWAFLTATPATIAAVWKSLGVAYYKTPDQPPLPADWLTGKPLTYDVSHQDVVYLIDPQGRERWLVSGTPSTAGAAPPSTLVKFLNDEGRANLRQPEDPGWTAGDVDSAISWLEGRHPVH